MVGGREGGGRRVLVLGNNGKEEEKKGRGRWLPMGGSSGKMQIAAEATGGRGDVAGGDTSGEQSWQPVKLSGVSEVVVHSGKEEK